MIQECPGCIQCDLHIGEHELHGLVLDDGLAESRAHLGVFNCLIQRALHDAERTVRVDAAAAVEALHRDVEASSFLSYQVVRRDPHVLEDDVRRIGEDHAHLVLGLSDRYAGTVTLNDKAADSLRAQVLVLGGEYGIDICDTAAGDETFLSVEDVLVAILDICRSGVACIGS